MTDRVVGPKAEHTLLALMAGEAASKPFGMETTVAVARESLPAVDTGVYTVRELLEAARALDGGERVSSLGRGVRELVEIAHELEIEGRRA